MTLIYLVAAFTLGLIAGCCLARSEVKRQTEALRRCRQALSTTALELQQANRHLHGERG